jgi:hypothetical protein
MLDLKEECCGWMGVVDDQQFIEESIKLDNNSWKRKIGGGSTLLGRSYAQETWKARKA